MVQRSALYLIVVVAAACGNSNPSVISDAGVDASHPDAAIDAPLDMAPAGVAVALGESAYTFETPDLSHTLTATVTGSNDATVTWSSSNTYIATVSAAGVVTSVSGGQVMITATSVADPTRSAAATVTIAEPNRAKAATFIDARTINSGPISILMCGDSLMRTYPVNSVDQTGWGQVLGQLLTGDATVDNSFPNGGRSSRSFYNEVGRWDQVKAHLAASHVPTFVMIQFAHNDQKKITDDAGPDYLTFARTNQNGTVAGTYYDYLERYIVETRALGGIPILVTPFVREYLEGSPARVSATGQHNITEIYAGETTARGDYPAAMKAVAAKHDVPVVDITTWSTAMVEARAAAATLPYVYISSDQTHIRELGALLMAQEVIRQLNAQDILIPYAKPASPRLMLDTSSIAFGGIFAGNTLDRSFLLTPFGDASGTITITAPDGYTVSTDGTTFAASATITADASYAGTKAFVRFAPADAIVYNADLTVTHSSLTLDYGNTAPNAAAGIISLTGNGKAVASGTPATATWPMFSGTNIVLDPTTEGAISATAATLTGLRNKNVNNSAARFDTLDGAWPAEGARAADRYVEFTVPVTTGSFTLNAISVDAGSGGGSNLHWDIVYSLAPDFGSPTDLGTGLGGAKDTLARSSFPTLGLNITAGQTLRLRVYPYNSTAATGKSLMLANVIVSGVTN
jgi:lysophospholipase L1-like esterase